jgi:hypothetical protein
VADLIPTCCPHNGQGQVVLADRPTTCRMCGAPIQASKAAGMIPSEGPNALDEAYPGDAANTAVNLSL